MCKVLMFSNFSKVAKTKLVVDTIFELITASDDDGFGYAIQGKRGVFGEKTLNDKWKYGSKVHAFMNNKSDEAFGTASDFVGPALFHGRTSTNQVNLLNTHPLQKHGWTLIHNGVVTNHGPAYAQLTSNDTEHVLEHLATGGIDAVAQNLTGYYAVGAIAPDGKLHIIRDRTAQLHVCYSKTLESFIFGTTKQLIDDFCEALKIQRGSIQEYSEATYTVMQKNKVLSVETFEPRGYGYRESNYAEKSLGYQIGTGTTYEDYGTQVEESEIEIIPTFLDYIEGKSIVPKDALIIDQDGYILETWQFKQLDNVSKMLCTIELDDGTALRASERDFEDALQDQSADIRG